MKFLISTAAMLFAAAVLADGNAMPRGFTDDLPAAVTAAETSGRKLFLLFTGSDWCPVCVDFKANVLSDIAFAELAREKYELVYLDYPEKHPLPPSVAQRNEAVRRIYGVNQFPTVLITDAAGRGIVAVGYRREKGAEPFLARLNAAVDDALRQIAAQPTKDGPSPETETTTDAKDEADVACEDGVCRFVRDDETSVTVPTDSPKPRLAHGILSVDDFLAFLRGGEQASPFAGKTAVVIAFLILLGGLLLNLTPCVLPMIPVNLLIIGNSFRRACVFACGIVLGYGLLGLAASLFGFATSAFASSEMFNGVFFVVLVVLALAQFGVFDFHLFRGRLWKSVDGGLPIWGVFLMGLVSAAFAGACVAPVLVAVLTLTAERVAAGQSLAVAYPFLLGLGLALPWPFIGAGIKVLPKPGAWMQRVNRVLGVVVLLTACWYGWQVVRGWGIERGFVDPRVVGEMTTETFDLTKLPRDKPILVDCWASWCKNCGAMDYVIEHSPSVQEELKRFHVIRLQTEDLKALKSKPGFESVKGLPAFVIFDQSSNGKDL